MQKWLAILLVIFSGSEAFCQDSKISVGVVFSPPLILETGGKILNSNEIRYNYSTGVGVDYKINSLFLLKSVIFYEKQFIKNEIYGPDERDLPTHLGSISYNYDYLVLPFLGSFKSNGKVFLYFDVGPYVAYLLKQKTAISSFYILPIPQTEGKGIRKQFDFGVNLAGGMCVPISKKVLFNLGFQANFGLINISKNPDADNGVIKTNSVGLLFGVKYKL